MREDHETDDDQVGDEGEGERVRQDEGENGHPVREPAGGNPARTVPVQAERPIERQPVNIHVVLDRVKAIARNGFARRIRLIEEYDPSLPPVFANRDQLVQVFLNLVKNAAEAIGSDPAGEIRLSTAFRPGIRLSVPGTQDRVSLPLEFCVQDNGPGVSDDILPILFDPFVTTKTNGMGIGLTIVRTIVEAHRGRVEARNHADGGAVVSVTLPRKPEARA